MLARLRTMVRGFWRRGQWEHELTAELTNHVEDRAADLVRRGMAPAEAHRQARIELGSKERYREEVRAESGFRWLDELHQDLRYAYRAMVRSPLFVIIAVVSIGLGVGANTVVFGVVNTLLLKPLPIDRPGEVYSVQPNLWPTFSFPNFRDVRARSTSFTDLAGFELTQFGLTAEGGAQLVWGALVTGNYFELLGVGPALGRFFTAEEDRGVGAAPLAVLSHPAWKTRFGGDSSLVGRAVTINGQRYTVVGVAGPGFFGTELAIHPEVFVPMSMQTAITHRSTLEDRTTWNTFVVGRLKPGITRDRANSELAIQAAALAKEYPQANEGLTISLSRPGLFGGERRTLVAAFSTGVLALAVLVLLAACANLASLFAARVADRHRELALRMSIGAGRGRIVRQLITETLVVASLGGLVGWFLATWSLARLSGWRPSGVPLHVEISPDWRVFVAAFLTTVAAGLLAALAPARLAIRVDLNAALKEGSATTFGTRRWTLREVLLVAQVGAAALLVTTCLVSIRGLNRAFQVPIGFITEQVDAVGFELAAIDLSDRQSYAFQRRAMDAVAGLPGVRRVAFGSSIPLSPYQSHPVVFRRESITLKPTEAITPVEYTISPDYLAVLGIPVVAGRNFTWDDDTTAPAVAIVNRRFAALVLGPGSPIGQQFRGGGGDLIEVVGLVEDGRYESLAEAPKPAVFWPAAQLPESQTFLFAQSDRPPGSVAGEIRTVISSLDPNLPLTMAGAASELTGYSLIPARVAAVALSAFGMLAMMLAITGINGMAAYAVSRRTREIGIRMALGAGPGTVLAAVFGRTATIVAAGSVVGVGLALLIGPVVASVVPQASTREPIILVAAALAMVAIGVFAAAIPARRAMAVGPLNALKAG